MFVDDIKGAIIKIEVYDALGRLLKTKLISPSARSEIDINEMLPQFLFLRVFTNSNEIAHFKILKQ